MSITNSAAPCIACQIRLIERVLPMPNACDFAPVNSRWRHRNGSEYTIVAHGRIEIDMTPCIVYRADGDDNVWVRPTHEFLDGRFTPICKLTES